MKFPSRCVDTGESTDFVSEATLPGLEKYPGDIKLNPDSALAKRINDLQADVVSAEIGK
jgi:hypothetical protein